ncbi:MAG: HAD hydrolase family protein [Planctomycetota bacterium]|jgi:3-deoxy-D-manno-octulosonate 8-phosphate phosphatase (KDO 8-P phosphatase)|nr:HAD hydrolase family protein [Planctomycetota bacterium]
MSKEIDKNGDFKKKLQAIKFLVLDVDGVMSDGKIGYMANGDEWKAFDAKDGAGVKYWVRAGHRAGIITGRSSPLVDRRAAELDIEFVEQNAKSKLPVFMRMLGKAGVRPEEVAVMGDDIADIPLIRAAGAGVAVADATEETRDAALWVTKKNGGHGAIREVIETILKVQGRWSGILERHLP